MKIVERKMKQKQKWGFYNERRSIKNERDVEYMVNLLPLRGTGLIDTQLLAFIRSELNRRNLALSPKTIVHFIFSSTN